LKPVLRSESAFSLRVAALIAVAAVLLLMVASLVGSAYPEGSVPLPLTALAALALGPPLALAGYTFLRSDELEPYRGRELWLRALACGLAYALLWGAYAWLQSTLGIRFEVYQLAYVVPPLVLAGAFAAFVSLDIDYTAALMHYALYLIVTVALRCVAGMSAF
jgi:hypothetical protein